MENQFIIIVIILLIVVAIIVYKIFKRIKYYGGNQSTIDWPVFDGFNSKMIDECVDFVKTLSGYGPVNADQIKNIQDFTEKINGKYSTKILPKNIISIRNIELAIKIRDEGNKIGFFKDIIIDKYRNNDLNILELSEKIKISPMNIVRQLLTELKIPIGSVEKFNIPDNILNQINIARKYDISSDLNAADTKNRAQEYEDKVCNFLRKKEIKFITEDELRHKQILEIGRPYLTPDILLKEPIFINTSDSNPTKIYWIDAKNYTLYYNNLVISGLKKQAIKYTNYFGPGAMVFGGGFVEGSEKILQINGINIVKILDGSFIK
jgi:hypothetical protein